MLTGRFHLLKHVFPQLHKFLIKRLNALFKLCLYLLHLVLGAESAVSLGLEVAVASSGGTQSILFSHDIVELADVNFVVNSSKDFVEVLQVSLL